MAVRSPNIDQSTATAGSQRDADQTRLENQRSVDLGRILTQYGSVADLIKAVESGSYTTDQATLANAGKVATANQGVRYTDQQRQSQELARNQGTADTAAAQARADANARSTRESDALKAVDDAYSGYDNKFFSDYSSNIIGSELPGIQQTYKEKGRVTDAGLAQRGIGQSSAGARIVGNLRGAQASDEASLAQRASDATETLRATLDANRANAVKEALAAADIQQNTPVAGATVGEILAARSAGGGAAAGPGLPAAPKPLSAPPGGGAAPSVPAAPAAPAAPPATGGGGGGGGGGGTDQGAIFNSNPRGGQISGVDESGNWLYAHQPGSDGYDDFAAGGNGGSAVAPIQIPTVKTAALSQARSGRTMEAPISLADAGIQMPLQPAVGSTGDTTALTPPAVDNYKKSGRNRPQFGPPALAGAAGGNATAGGGDSSGPQTLSPNDPRLAGRAVGGGIKPPPAPDPTYGVAANAYALPEALGGTGANDVMNAPRKSAAAQPGTLRQALAGAI